MKLRNLVLVAALSLPVLALADDMSTNPFAGAFAGAGVGYSGNDAKLSATGATTVDFGKGGLAGQVLGGYNYGIDANWLVGAEAFFSDNTAKVDGTFATDSVTAKMNQVYGADVLLGYAFNQTSLFYGGAGIASSKLKLGGDLNNSTHFTGWRVVAGAQQVLTGSLSLRESVDYTMYKSKTIDTVATVKPKQFTSMLSLIYTFNM